MPLLFLKEVKKELIELCSIDKVFETDAGAFKALEDVSITINDGDIFGIIGLSGAGKSTLVRCINLLERPTSGKVLIDGKDIMSLSKKELIETRKNIGMIFQSFNLLSQRNVLKNVTFPLELQGVKSYEAKQRARELLALVGLSDKEKSYPAQLSGGQKQRVAIARALATNPKYLLCDEATSALDPNTITSILSLLKEINRKLGITIVVITHEMRVVESICNKVAVIDGGKIAEMGDVKDVFISPKSAIAKELILPKSRAVESVDSDKVIRIVFDGQSSNEPVISNLTVECRAAVNILGADTKNIDGKAFGQMLLQLPEDTAACERIMHYLDTRGIHYEEVQKS